MTRPYAIPASPCFFLTPAQALDSAFPYNQSFAKTVNLGGGQIGAQFNAALFVGSNFDCTQPEFNLEGYITANATVTVFGNQMSALVANAIYGSEGSSVVANQLYLEVFEKVIYNQQIPVPDLNCQQQSLPLGSFTAPGLNAAYTVRRSSHFALPFPHSPSALGRLHPRDL